MGKINIMMMMMMMMWLTLLVVNGGVQVEAHKAEVGGGDSMKMLDTLCAAATYKDTCKKSLQSVANNPGTTPQMLVERGMKMALDEMDKASKLTDTLLSRGKDKSAVESCKHLLEQAKERIQGAMAEAHNGKNFKDQAQVFDIRIKLGDVNTFATTCVDEAPPQLQQVLRDGTSYATELSVNMFDVVTIFNQALSQKLLLPSSSVIPISRRLLNFS